MKRFLLVAILILVIILSMNRLEPFKQETLVRKVQIADRIKPPNVYTTPNLGYSLETVMAHILKKCP